MDIDVQFSILHAYRVETAHPPSSTTSKKESNIEGYTIEGIEWLVSNPNRGYTIDQGTDIAVAGASPCFQGYDRGAGSLDQPVPVLSDLSGEIPRR